MFGRATPKRTRNSEVRRVGRWGYGPGFGGSLGLLEDWLGGLDSNQDNQIQNLMYCQLYDLPSIVRIADRRRSRRSKPLYILTAVPSTLSGARVLGP
jgi:hypothetical protein